LFNCNVGGERTKDAKELLYARQKLVLVAKAFQLQAIDLVHIDYKGKLQKQIQCNRYTG